MSIEICSPTLSLIGSYLLVVSLISCHQKPTPAKENQPGIFVEDYSSVIDSLVPSLIEEYNAPAVGIAIVEDGEVQMTKVYGEHQIGQRAPENTVFNVASVTKPIVATVVMKLVANGDWDLDEPLYNYYLDPQIAQDDNAKLITTRHCLSHSTGFKNWRWNEKDGKLRINFTPGTRFMYSGEGMEFLRHALETKFNQGLDKIVDSLLFEPFDMKDATMGWLSDEDTVRFAKWYDARGEQHDINYKIEKINAADDMLLTMQDLATFSRALMDYEILSEATYEKMIEPHTSINKKLSQTLGWVRYDGLPELGPILNHDGGDPGVVTTLILVPGFKSAIALSVNSDNGANITNAVVDAIVPQGRQIIEGLHWENTIPKKVELEKAVLQRYAGTYTTDQGFDITFTATEDALITESEVFPMLKLWPMTQEKFFPLPFEIYFEFVESDDPLAFHLLTSDGSIDLRGQKVEQ